MVILTASTATVIPNLEPDWRLRPHTTHSIYSDESIFRQPPSDKVEEAWKRIADIGVLPISYEDVVALGKDPSSVAKAPMNWGQGSEAYLAHLDGIHLLHCLDSMRQSLYYNFHHYHPNGTTEGYHVHLSHCQEALAKHLMCQPSVELITYSWAEEKEFPFPDFDITRKCWNYETLLDWQDQHRIKPMTTEIWQRMRRPNDVKPIPYPILMAEVKNVSRSYFEDNQ
jgi:Mycotoxin biosynthesis protein UstYa